MIKEIPKETEDSWFTKGIIFKHAGNFTSHILP